MPILCFFFFFFCLFLEIERQENKTLLAKYHIENATNHILTFSLTMEPSDTFAFQGPKQLTVRMLPCTRRSFEYTLLPLTRGLLAIPGLVVYDINYKKILVPLAATPELKVEKKSLLVVC